MKNKKPIIITSIVVLLLLVVVGVTYAFFSYESGTKSDIVTGQIYMNYEETSTISLTGVFPETKAQALARQDKNGVFEFTITGRNTSKYPVYYEIDLLDGGVITGKTAASTKILPEHVMIYLERDGEPLVDGVTYEDFNNRRIYVDTIPANQTSNIEHKYTLRMWIDENVTISDTDPSADYKTTEWNDSYASLKVRVVGDFEYKEVATDASCFTYNVLNNTEIEITSYDETCGMDVVIPSVIEGLPVTRIADGSKFGYSDIDNFANRNLTSVKLPNTLEYIGTYAFSGNSLTEIIISDGVNTIGSSAFSGNSLTEIIIPDSVITIGSSAFEDNRDLRIVTLGKNVSQIDSNAFKLSYRWKSSLEKIVNKSGNAFNWTSIFGIGSSYIVQDPGIVATGTYIYNHTKDGNKTVLITSE